MQLILAVNERYFIIKTGLLFFFLLFYWTVDKTPEIRKWQIVPFWNGMGPASRNGINNTDTAVFYSIFHLDENMIVGAVLLCLAAYQWCHESSLCWWWCHENSLYSWCHESSLYWWCHENSLHQWCHVSSLYQWCHEQAGMCTKKIKHVTNWPFSALYCYRANQHGCSTRNSKFKTKKNFGGINFDQTTKRILRMEILVPFLRFQANLHLQSSSPVSCSLMHFNLNRIYSSLLILFELNVSCLSGVLFTADPVTNNIGVIVINANFGLGEVSVTLSVSVLSSVSCHQCQVISQCHNIIVLSSISAMSPVCHVISLLWHLSVSCHQSVSCYQSALPQCCVISQCHVTSHQSVPCYQSVSCYQSVLPYQWSHAVLQHAGLVKFH